MTQIQRNQMNVTRMSPALHSEATHSVNVVNVQMDWLTAFERLHPITQVSAAVVAGLGVAFVAVSAVGIVSTMATFALSAMAILSQFALTVGAGLGLLALVIIGVVAILKVGS